MPGTDVIEHKIEVTSEKPIRLRAYRATPAARAEIDRQLNEMLETGILAESDSPWSAPVLLVKKANGDQRLVIDYRQLNHVTKDRFQSLPPMDEIIDCMAERHPTIFSSLDLFSGYLQIPMEQSSRKYTALTANGRHLEFLKMPFGAKGSPFTFIELITKILKNINYRYAMAYLDDVAVFSSNMAEHLMHIDEIFQRFRAAKLRLNPKKCKFALSEIKFLRHIINKNGISIDHSKDAVILDFPRPKNVKQVRSFIGVCTYWKRYIKDFAKIINPLNKLLRKSVPFVWTDECEIAFNSMKTKLTTAPILQFPDLNKEFTLVTDASTTAIGYYLTQLGQDSRPRVVSFGGRGLRPNETQFGATEIELSRYYAGNSPISYLLGT